MHGSEQRKYGAMSDGFRMEYANKSNRYSKTVFGMIDVMRQVKEPKSPKKPKTNANEKGKDTVEETGTLIKPEINFAQNNGGKVISCFCCGGPHLLRNCGN